MLKPTIDFVLIAKAALSSARRLLADWLPGGEWSGFEYKPLNPTRDDRKIGSFVVNASTGKWIDNATGDSGGDLISLYAYVRFMSQKDAAIEVAGMVGVDVSVDGEQRKQSSGRAESFQNNQEKVITAAEEHRKSPWVAIMPVPSNAPPPPVAHYVRGRPDVVFAYRALDGGVNGYVYRFTTSDGGKETLPVCFCRNDEVGKLEWRWMAFSDTARPLYGLDRLASSPDLPVLLVEGEKCADAAHAVLKDHFAVVSWASGTKAVHKSDWAPLVGRKVFAWADCDAKHQKLTREQKAAGIDMASLPLLAESDQPGMRAMRDIRKILSELDPQLDFKFIDIPKPGEKPDGWDIADAIDEGFGVDLLIDFISKTKHRIDQKKTAAINRSDAGLLLNRDYKIVPCLANIYDILRTDERWAGVLAFNEFSYTIEKRTKPPFEFGAVGEWEANDDVQASMWLTREYGFAPSPAQVGEAVEALARANGFHPVREYLDGLVWDGVARVDEWIFDYIGAAKTPYTLRVARWFLMGMVARVMDPGVKFDCCLVLEGTQGRRKSAMLRVLAGEWFGDTDLDLNNKDSMGSIRGKWLYEFAELDSIARAESTRQKSFLSRQVDEYRPPYGRRDIRSPRQLVFGGSTNVNWGWNKDETGGRRFWPIECAYDIDCDGLMSVRDQLFAEAVQLYRQGKRFWPTSEEQKRIFDPVQMMRHQTDSYVELLADFVRNQVSEFRMIDAVDCLKIDAARLTRDIQTRVGKALIMLGCKRVEKRANAVRFWYQPPGTPGGMGDKSDGFAEGSDDGIPF
jgi:putative DNA primase/helicase